MDVFYILMKTQGYQEGSYPGNKNSLGFQCPTPSPAALDLHKYPQSRHVRAIPPAAAHSIGAHSYT